jgi:hypothetical protein
MVVQVSVRIDDSQLEARLNKLQTVSMRRATIDGINETAFEARRDLLAEMDRAFDRPTPFAKRGLTVVKAGGARQFAEIEFSGSRASGGGLPPAYFMRPGIEGGRRSLKAFETQLVERGWMKPGEVAVPTKRLPRDRFGNVSQGQLNRIMSGLAVDYRGAGSTRVASTEPGKRRARASIRCSTSSRLRSIRCASISTTALNGSGGRICRSTSARRSTASVSDPSCTIHGSLLAHPTRGCFAPWGVASQSGN